MSYFTSDNLTAYISQGRLTALTDYNNDGDTDSGALEDAEAFAREKIDASLRNVYEVPFSTAPEIVKYIAMDIAVWYLSQKKSVQVSPDTEKRYERALSDINKLRKGEMSLPAEYARTSKKAAFITVSKTADDKIFSISNKASLNRWQGNE